jgi:hypothetical protein
VRSLALIFLVACKTSTPAPTPTTPPATPPPTSPTTPPASASDETFTGTLTEVDFGCAADASCDVVVDGSKRVHFGHDTRREGPTTWGNTEQIFTLMDAPKQGVGRRVEVFAAKKPDGGYTLQGKAEYYIKVLP